MKRFLNRNNIGRKIISALLAIVIMFSTSILSFAAVGDNRYTETESNNSIGTANLLYNNYTVSGTLYDYDLDYYKFTVSSKSNISFVAITNSSKVKAAFCDSNGDIIKVADQEYRSSGNYALSWIGTATAGTYYLLFLNSERYYSTEYMFYFECVAQATPHTHTYSNACDTTCNGCGAIRTITHTYTNACDTSCNVCGATRSITHTYSNACDTTCNVCGATRTPLHAFSSVCDEICDYCGEERVAKHAYGDVIASVCNLCGKTRNVQTWQIKPDSTGVYNIIPRKTLSGFSKDSIAVADKNQKEVKYNTTKCGWPLAVNQEYTIVLYGDYTNTDNLTWNLEKVASKIFPDTASSGWYIDAVTYVVGAGIMNGKNANSFGTDENLKRQDFVVMLSRLAGIDEAEYDYASDLTDVKGGYYRAAVNWAKVTGVTSGYTSGPNAGKFGVGDNITREQIVTFLYRYAQKINADTTISANAEQRFASQFNDFGRVSDFAKEAIIWALDKGVITGRENENTGERTIAPQGNASRAEIAKMMYNVYLNDIF